VFTKDLSDAAVNKCGFANDTANAMNNLLPSSLGAVTTVLEKINGIPVDLTNCTAGVFTRRLQTAMSTLKVLTYNNLLTTGVTNTATSLAQFQAAVGNAYTANAVASALQTPALQAAYGTFGVTGVAVIGNPPATLAPTVSSVPTARPTKAKKTKAPTKSKKTAAPTNAPTKAKKTKAPTKAPKKANNFGVRVNRGMGNPFG